MKQHTITFKYLHVNKDFLHEESDTLIPFIDVTESPYDQFEELIEQTGNPSSRELRQGMIFFTRYNLSDDASLSIDYDLD